MTRSPHVRRFALGVALVLTFSLLQAGNISAQTLLVDDTQVNAAAGDPGDNTTQSETSLAVRGNTVCAGFNDSGPTNFSSYSGFARSTNRGQTWTDQGELGIGNSGDPTLAVNQGTGTFYYGENATIAGNSAIGVARSTDDCQSFGNAVDASAASSGLSMVGNITTLSDKPSIAVDNSGGANNGNLYVCWTRFIDTSNPPNGQDTSELRFSRSTDGGATYVNEQVIQAQGLSPFGCSVKVGPNGQVYVVWADRTGATQGDIRFRVSTDGGQNFGANVQVSTGNRQPGTDRVASCVNPNDRFTLNGNIRMLHQAWLAVDTTGSANNGNLYVVWASDPAGATDNSDVFFSRSTNGGATWGAPVQLGGGTATDQFEPNVAVGGDEGMVSVAWYDRRNDTANNFNVDVFKAFSIDGGQTFGAIQRVTNQNWGVPQLIPNFDNQIVNCYMGEYIGIAADAGRFYYLWGDNRNTVTNVNWPAGRPDPDIFFETESAPDQPITATGMTINIVEGAPFSGVVATFTDPDTTATASEYGATIDWGDGSPVTTGTISGPTGGPFAVSGSHIYITDVHDHRGDHRRRQPDHHGDRDLDCDRRRRAQDGDVHEPGLESVLRRRGCLVHRRQSLLDACRLQRVDRLGRSHASDTRHHHDEHVRRLRRQRHALVHVDRDVHGHDHDQRPGRRHGHCLLHVPDRGGDGGRVVRRRRPERGRRKLRNILGRSVGEGKLAQRRAGSAGLQGLLLEPEQQPGVRSGVVDRARRELRPAFAPATGLHHRARRQLDLEDGIDDYGQHAAARRRSGRRGVRAQSRPRRNGNHCGEALLT
jgi:hypothetical protein